MRTAPSRPSARACFVVAIAAVHGPNQVRCGPPSRAANMHRLLSCAGPIRGPDSPSRDTAAMRRGCVSFRGPRRPGSGPVESAEAGPGSKARGRAVGKPEPPQPLCSTEREDGGRHQILPRTLRIRTTRLPPIAVPSRAHASHRQRRGAAPAPRSSDHERRPASSSSCRRVESARGGATTRRAAAWP